MTTCEAEQWTKGTPLVFRNHPQVDQRYRGKEMVFICHLPHVGISTGYWLCTKVRDLEMPEWVTLVKASLLEKKEG
jgi:hypothetical protein